MQNLSNKEIGSKLHMSERTAKFHVSNLLAKYAVQRRADLILLFVQAERVVAAPLGGKSAGARRGLDNVASSRRRYEERDLLQALGSPDRRARLPGADPGDAVRRPVRHFALLEAPHGPLLVAAMVFSCLIWPHAAYFFARRARDTKQAELRNLLVDSFIVGCWIAAMSFSLWPTVAMIATMLNGNLAVGGCRFAGKGLVGILLGILATGAAARVPRALRLRPRDDGALDRRPADHDLHVRHPLVHPDFAGLEGQGGSGGAERADPGAVPRDRAGAAVRAGGQGLGRGGQPRQERVPREHEPRAPHAAERDHRLQRDARGGRAGQPATRPSFPISRRSAPPASTCSA